jgi:hypothetical protein
MLKALYKIIIFALLLTLSTVQDTYAVTRLYKYDGNMPFVKMMLSMMVAMGIIDKVPAYGAYGYSGYPGMLSPGYNNLYLRSLYSRNPYLWALAQRGVYPDASSNPFHRAPWLSSPWTGSTPNTASPLWGSPDWGVLPPGRYGKYKYPWTAADVDGWASEPWEVSSWNPEAETSEKSDTATIPLVQNFNYNVTDKEARDKHSPLRKLVPPERKQRTETKSDKSSRSREKYKEKPCVTDYCGLKKPDLDGLWVAQNGEMLGINDKRYLWSDGYSNYLSGQIKIQNEYLLTSVDDYETLMRFKYKLSGDHLLTLRPDGTVSEFIRLPVNYYRNNYSGSGWEDW